MAHMQFEGGGGDRGKGGGGGKRVECKIYVELRARHLRTKKQRTRSIKKKTMSTVISMP